MDDFNGNGNQGKLIEIEPIRNRVVGGLSLPDESKLALGSDYGDVCFDIDSPTSFLRSLFWAGNARAGISSEFQEHSLDYKFIRYWWFSEF